MADKQPTRAQRTLAKQLIGVALFVFTAAFLAIERWFFFGGWSATPSAFEILMLVVAVAMMFAFVALLCVGVALAWEWLHWVLTTPVAEKPKTGDEWEDS